MNEKKDIKYVSDDARLAAEWNWDKNNGLLPSEITVKSSSKVWWKCRLGHEWQATVNSRRAGCNCPICANQVILPGYNDLATKNPLLTSEWCYEKNGKLTPNVVPAGSNKKVWWKCKCGHEWVSSIGNRNRGSGCPYCSGCLPIPGKNDLKTAYPDIAAEWNSVMNGELTPELVSIKSNKKVWWKCKYGHEWETIVGVRTLGRGCPYCSNQKLLAGYNDLATVNPELVDEWNFEKNNELLPSQILSGSSKKVWWKCKYGHEWMAVVVSRKNGCGCPVCNKRNKTSFPEQCIYYYVKSIFADVLNGDMQALQGKMELDVFIPSISTAIEYDGSYWHTPELFQREKKKYKLCKGNNIRLIRVRENADSEISSICDNLLSIEHAPKYEQIDLLIRGLFDLLGVTAHMDINSMRDKNKILTSYVSSLKASSLAELNPTLAKEWHPTKNGDLVPNMFTVSSGEMAWWLGQCGHEWKATIANRNGGTGCPYCNGQKRIVGQNDFATLYPRIAEEWHPTKNLGLKSTEVGSKSNLEVWWLGKCGHEWKAKIADRTRGQGCPYCSNHQILEGYNDLATINPALASEWHPYKNGILTPSMVSHKSNKKVWWLGKCGHEWKTIINNRSKGSGCPYCANKKVLAGFNDLETKNPALASEWHPTKNGVLVPNMVTDNSGKKVWWLGKCGHEWETRISHRNGGSGCPYCYQKKKAK